MHSRHYRAQHTQFVLESNSPTKLRPNLDGHLTQMERVTALSRETVKHCTWEPVLGAHVLNDTLKTGFGRLRRVSLPIEEFD